MHQAFLRAICEDPADDTPRLVFADWLEEHGQTERAAVIRMECNYARALTAIQEQQERVRTRPGQPLCNQLWHERECLPWQSTYRDWRLADFQGWPGPEGCGYRWERGFIVAISLPLDAFLSCAAALFAGAPITRVTLTDRKPIPIWPHRRPGWLRSASAVAYCVPPAVFDHLCDGALLPASTTRFYETEPTALVDLCVACVAWGRERAGLPPLPTAVTMEPVAHV